MTLFLFLFLFLFLLGLSGVLSVFVFYPLFLWLVSIARKRDGRQIPGPLPSVSVLVAVRNGQEFIASKIENTLSLDYPREKVELIMVSDGSSDDTVKVMQSCRDPGVKCFFNLEHHGKAQALNQGFRECTGEILVFSDADALLERDALRKLVRHYADPQVGGVCGQRVIGDRQGELKKAQSRYIHFDSTIKAFESKVGSITSNDGKLYSIRRCLFRPIDPGSTDDLYVSLQVVRQGYRFTFEPEARACVRMPSRSPAHEASRRRRIVARSLRGIFLMRELLNPFRHGVFSIGLLINKVVRRFLPICLILLFVGTLCLSWKYPLLLAFLALQAAFYGAALAYPVLVRIAPRKKKLGAAAALPLYFCIGNYGTLLGLIDFLLGRKVTRWDPLKAG